jgi:hypothetical protein
MRRRSLTQLLVGLLALIPQVASANAGTPLMWAGMLHLVFGNALIGLGEGLLIAFVFKRPKARCIGLMIAANYFSAWLGGWALVGGIANKLDWNLYNAWQLFWTFVAATYLMTILLEVPFVALCFWRQERWLVRSFKASLLAQTVSYVLLFGWYWGASGKSLYTRMKVVQPSEIRLPENLQLYYISAQDGRVHQGSQIVGNVTSTNRNDRLLIRPIAAQTNQWELAIRLDGRRDEDAIISTVLSPIQNSAAAVEPGEEHRPNGRDTWFNFGDVLVMGGQSNTNWEIWTGFWPIEGMRFKNNKTGESTHFAWETLFSQWNARNAILLPNDKVIFQLGEDQICALDLPTKRIALLARGRGPTAVLK